MLFSNFKTKVDLPDPVGPHIIEVNGFFKRNGSINPLYFGSVQGDKRLQSRGNSQICFQSAVISQIRGNKFTQHLRASQR